MWPNFFYSGAVQDRLIGTTLASAMLAYWARAHRGDLSYAAHISTIIPGVFFTGLARYTRRGDLIDQSDLRAMMLMQFANILLPALVQSCLKMDSAKATIYTACLIGVIASFIACTMTPEDLAAAEARTARQAAPRG